MAQEIGILDAATSTRSAKTAAVIGFGKQEYEILSLLLTILGWQVTERDILNEEDIGAPQLIFWNARNLVKSELISTVAVHSNRSVFGIVIDERPPAWSTTIAYDGLHWLVSPLDIEHAEQIIESAS